MSFKKAQRETIVATLDHEVRDALNSKHGKPTVSVSFVSECRFCHIIPALVGMAFFVRAGNGRPGVGVSAGWHLSYSPKAI
jgi:hypothetical protein